MSESETSESAEKDSIIDRMTKLSGDEVAQQFQGKLKKKLVETFTSFSSPVWNWALSYFWMANDFRLVFLERTFVYFDLSNKRSNLSF